MELCGANGWDVFGDDYITKANGRAKSISDMAAPFNNIKKHLWGTFFTEGAPIQSLFIIFSSELQILRRSCIRANITDIRNTCYIHQKSFKTKTEAGMYHSAVLSQV